MDFESARASVVDYLDRVVGRRSAVELAAGITAGCILTYSLWKYFKSLGLPPGPTGKIIFLFF